MSEDRSPIIANPTNGGVFGIDTTPPNTIIINDMDLGNDPNPVPGEPISDLEGYWDRANGVVFPKINTDKVGIGVSSFTDDSILHVAGRIFAAGLRLGDNVVLYEDISDHVVFNIGGTAVLGIGSLAITGTVFYLGATGVTYSFVGDIDSGLRRVSDNTIAITTAGSDRFVVNSSGTIKILSTPGDDSDNSVVLVWDSVTKEVRIRDLTELHTHSNLDVLNALTDGGGILYYGDDPVADFSNYYDMDAIDNMVAILENGLDGKGPLIHTHALADLSERSYNSLTDRPDLTSIHSHANKTVLDKIPDDTNADDGDVLTKDGAGIAWLPPTSGGDLSYLHTQSVPAASWSVTHNLGKNPTVCIVNDSGDAVLCDIEYVDSNHLTITAAGAFSGKAYCN